LSGESNARYPALFDDLRSLKENPGLWKYVLDTLVDLDVIVEGVPKARKSGDIERVGSLAQSEEGDTGVGGEGTMQENLRPASGNIALASQDDNCKSGGSGSLMG
jgi:hypothetical protein